MKNGRKHAVIPIFVPHKGCPHDCIFCNQKKISGQIEEMTVEKMYSIIEDHLQTIKPGTKIEIGFYGGSFTGIDKKQQIEFLSAADRYVRDGYVSGIRLSTRPDCIDNTVLDYLEYYHVKIIELGVQSLDEDVLKASFRGHTAEDVYRSSSLISERGFGLGIQTMVGLPSDTREKDIDTALKVVGLSPALVRIYPVLVIRGTYLEKLLYEGSYQPPSLEEAVDTCGLLLDIYEAADVDVIRVGLQSSENISEDAEIAGGPVHPAFRQLVESKRALRCAEAEILRQNLAGHGNIIIRTGLNNLSNIIGQKRCNIGYLKEKYMIGSIKVESMEGLEREIRVGIC